MRLALAAWLVITLGMLTACGTTSGLSKQELKARKAAQVKQNLADMRFTIDVRMMYPLRGVPKHLDYGYEVKIQGDSLYSHLPYFGRAYNIPYGGGKGLRFQERIVEKQVSQPKNGLTALQIYVRNEEDDYLYYVEVWENGSASVEVRSRERERISFSGEMKLEE